MNRSACARSRRVLLLRPLRWQLVVAILLFTLPLAAAVPGESEFRRSCAGCHGLDGKGGERAPAAQPAGRTAAQIAELIRSGIPARGMPAFPHLSAAEVQALAGFVSSVTPPAAPVARLAVRPLPFSELVSPPAGSWPTYHGQLSGNRHSSLSAIHRGNVSRLALRWMATLPGAGQLQVTPVVIDDVMYITAANECHALDARNGRRLWSYRRPRTKGVAGDAGGGVNRGVAVLGTRLFLVTDDAHLLALDRASGELLWDKEMADHRLNYGATSAPLVVGGLVLSGTSGGDEGVRGFLAAFRAETGNEVWRHWTVPRPGEAGAETWGPQGLEHSCASTWLTGSYDSSTRLVYWATGNPCPDFNGDQRPGDNLYSASVLALRPADGSRVWYYQFTPHDTHDWDAQQTLMLVDAPFGGRTRSLLLQANRNGFFYVLDRTSGKLLRATPFVKNLTWARGIGADGRPILLPGSEPTDTGSRVCPSVDGATNWMSTAFNPQTGFFYVMTREMCSIYRKEQEVWRAGKSFYGGGIKDPPGERGQKVLRALNLATGAVAWEYPQTGTGKTWGGLLSTAGGLVFLCDDSGDFTAVDAATGKRLWAFPANQFWHASPMTFTVAGRQLVAIAGGPNILVFGMPEE